MSKHTPGPWQSMNDYDWMDIIGNIDGPDEGQMHYTLVAVVDDEKEIPEARANARLIAAAPELLEALQTIAAGLNFPIATANEKAAVEVARAAIAKATGEPA